MARGVNKVIILGNLGADPEMKYTANGTAVCNLRIATSEAFKGQDGNWQERTEWHRVVVYGKSAENCGQYLSKGRQVYIEGRLQTRSWDDQSGQKRWMTEIVAREVQFLGGGQQGGQGGGYGGQGGQQGGQGGGYGGGYGQQQGGHPDDGFGGPPPSDDDIPF